MTIEHLEARLTALERENADRARWQAEYDGRTGAWWDSQHAWNARIESRVVALERVAWKAVGIGSLILSLVNVIGYYLVNKA